ncbi:insulinase family protein [Vineibacter terrae]|uniref:Insulinase family protein n=1 Tax=Vineibacter terrae TaxID=2586908 RepID=A0A5C8P9B5_9HYPH|nr:insulinase family protein [Vineibacter terrae]
MRFLFWDRAHRRGSADSRSLFASLRASAGVDARGPKGRRAVIGIMAAIAAVICSALPAFAIDIKTLTTPGGIKLWLVEDRTAPVIAMSFSFEGGSAQDPAGKEGLAQLTASLLDQGAGTYDAAAFKRRQEDVAARLSFGVSVDRFGGTVRMLRQYREESVDLLRLALTEPRFDAESIRRLQRQFVSGLKQAEQSPSSVANRTLLKATFGQHVYGRPPDGTVAGIEAVMADDLRMQARRQFARDRLHLAIVGDITAEEAGALVDRAFGTLPATTGSPDVPPWTPAPDRPGGRTLVVERDVPQSVALIATPGIKRDDPDWYAATVMNHVLGGGGFSGRLMNEVREKRGLAYGAYSRLSTYRQAGLLIASVGTANERVAESVKIIREQLALLAKDGITEDELANAKAYLKGSLALTLDSTSSIAGLLHSMQVDGLPPEHMTRRNELIDRVTLDDVKRMAQRILRLDASVTVVVGKPQGIAATE